MNKEVNDEISKKFKYQAGIDKVKFCPPDNIQPCEEVIYRMIKNEVIQDSDLKPSMRNLAKPNNCYDLGISTYTTLEDITKKYRLFSRSLQKKYSAIAKASNIKDCGLGSKTLKNNHYTFYEFDNSNLLDRFVTIQKLN